MRASKHLSVWRVMAVLICVTCLIAQFGTPAYADRAPLDEVELSADGATTAPKAGSGTAQDSFDGEMQPEPTAKNASANRQARMSLSTVMRTLPCRQTNAARV